VDRAAFAYPGPPPGTRESGIIALSDVIEAASRSFTSRAEPELRGFVAKLIADRVSEGELAQCPLTLSEMARVQAAFVTWLKARNHFRPAYPGAAEAPTPASDTKATTLQSPPATAPAKP
jgi:membrane-associated HD superfamily phosphohydrolase